MRASIHEFISPPQRFKRLHYVMSIPLFSFSPSLLKKISAKFSEEYSEKKTALKTSLVALESIHLLPTPEFHSMCHLKEDRDRQTPFAVKDKTFPLLRGKSTWGNSGEKEHSARNCLYIQRHFWSEERPVHLPYKNHHKSFRKYCHKTSQMFDKSNTDLSRETLHCLNLTILYGFIYGKSSTVSHQVEKDYPKNFGIKFQK